MRTKLVKVLARLVDEFQRELHAIREPRTVQEMASGLACIPLSKDEDAARPAIVPNFLDAKAAENPEHQKFDELWFTARTAIVRDTQLEADFRALAHAVLRGAQARISEQEMSRWPFRGAMVSPAFIKEITERKGL